MTLLDGVPESEETLRLGVIARTRLIQLGGRMGLAADEIEALYLEGRALAKQLGDVRLLAGLIRFSATPHIFRGEFEPALALILEAVQLGDETDDAVLHTALWISPPVIYPFTGPLTEGLRTADKAIALCQDEPDRGAELLGYSPLVRNLLSRAQVLLFMGRMAEARLDADRAVSLGRQRSESEMMIWALSLYPHIAFHAGEGEDALALAQEAVQLAEESGNMALQTIALEALGIAELEAGQAEEAARHLRQAIDEGRAHGGIGIEEAGSLAHLARAHLTQGDREAARQAADEAVAVAKTQGARIRECLALLARAHVLRETEGQDAGEAIEADVAAGLALVKVTGAGAYEPLLHEELARLAGDKSGLRQALVMFAEIGGTGHVRRLEAELDGSHPPAPSTIDQMPG